MTNFIKNNLNCHLSNLFYFQLTNESLNEHLNGNEGTGVGDSSGNPDLCIYYIVKYVNFNVFKW